MRAVLMAAALAAAAPAWAQVTPATAPRTKVVEVFETEPCPKSDDPNEIIVCKRIDPDAQFRIPPVIREQQAAEKRDNVPATRSALVDQSMAPTRCTAAGIAGQAGCTGGLNVLAAGRKAAEAITGDEQVPDKAPQ